MNLRALLLPDFNQKAPLAVLLIRAAAGFVLVPHGYTKLKGGVEGFAAGLAGMGFPAPSFLAWSGTLTEFVGGLCLAVGLLTRPVAAFICGMMVIAWGVVQRAALADLGGVKGVNFEYPFLLSVIALALMISGPGRLSLDAVLVRRLK